MTSYDGGGFEEWVRDSLYGNVTDEKVRQVTQLLEPFREAIDDRLDNDFNSEEQSWRDYRNALWDHIPEDVQREVDAILEGRRTRFERVGSP